MDRGTKQFDPATTDVLLLAAGFGRRLLPLTERTPKPLLPLGGRPIIDYALRLIARSGFRRVFINLHYLGERIRNYVGNGESFGLVVEYSEEPVLLDTGGAIKNIEGRLRSAQLVTLNADTLFGPEFNLSHLLAAHCGGPVEPLATLVLREDPEGERYGLIGIDSRLQVVEFLGRRFGEPPERRLMYAGVQVLSREVLSYMPARGSIFSVTRDTYPKILADGGTIRAFIYNGSWSDLGTPERLAAASQIIERLFPQPMKSSRRQGSD